MGIRFICNAGIRCAAFLYSLQTIPKIEFSSYRTSKNKYAVYHNFMWFFYPSVSWALKKYTEQESTELNISPKETPDSWDVGVYKAVPVPCWSE